MMFRINTALTCPVERRSCHSENATRNGKLLDLAENIITHRLKTETENRG